MKSKIEDEITEITLRHANRVGLNTVAYIDSLIRSLSSNISNNEKLNAAQEIIEISTLLASNVLTKLTTNNEEQEKPSNE